MGQPPLGETVHQIRFRPGRVEWASSKLGSDSRPYKTFTTSRNVPVAEGMLVHINLWRTVSSVGSSAKVALRSFRFSPYRPSSTSVFLPNAFVSAASAEDACRAEGYYRLCKVGEAAGHGLCKGGWFADGQGFWLDRANECGHKGFNTLAG